MGFWQQIGIGFKGYFKALDLLFSKGFFKYMFFPLIINILLFWFGMSQVIDLAVIARDSFIEWINLGGAEFWGSGFLRGFLSGIITTLVYVLFFISFVYLGGYIIVIILSPLFLLIIILIKLATFFYGSSCRVNYFCTRGKYSGLKS